MITATILNGTGVIVIVVSWIIMTIAIYGLWKNVDELKEKTTKLSGTVDELRTRVDTITIDENDKNDGG